MTDSSTWPIEGQFSCGIGFLVAPDCLGKGFLSRTATHEVSVFLPEVGPDADDHELRHQPWKYVRRDEDVAEATQSGTEWGSIAGRTGGSPAYAHIRHCAFHTEVDAASKDEFEESAKRFGSELASWWDTLCDWLDVLTLQDFARLGRAQRSILHDAVHMWSGDTDGYRRAGVTYQVFPGGIHHVEILDREQMQAAMDLAATGEPPGTEWLLLRDARSFLMAGEYRRSVIDACTATELALTTLIDRKFSANGTPDAVRKKKFKEHHGLSKLMSLHKKEKASGTLPKRLVEEVAVPRNKAAHQGATLSEAEAQKAIRTAAEVVEAAFPLRSAPVGIASRSLRSSPRVGILPQRQDIHIMTGNSLLMEASMLRSP